MLQRKSFTVFNFVTLLTFNSGRKPSGRRLILFLANERELFAFHYRPIDGDLGDIFATRHLVHDIEHDPLEHGTQRAGARAG